MLTLTLILAASLVQPTVSASKSISLGLPNIQVSNASCTVYFSHWGETSVNLKYSEKGELTEVDVWTKR